MINDNKNNAFSLKVAPCLIAIVNKKKYWKIGKSEKFLTNKTMFLSRYRKKQKRLTTWDLFESKQEVTYWGFVQSKQEATYWGFVR